MNDVDKFKINNENNFIDISEEKKKDKYNEYISLEIKETFQSRLKYYSRYLK